MGKNKGGSHGHGGEEEKKKVRAFVLKVAMHCNCDGCIDKIRAAVKDITRLQGIESWDQSALETKGELKLVATADPEKLRQRLHKATRKNVDLIFPSKDNKDTNTNSKGGGKQAPGADQQALLLNLNRLLQQQGQNANQGVGWNTHGDYGAAVQSYPPWAVHQQPDPYSNGGGAWGGAYPYPPAQGGYGGAWHGHGY